MRLRSPAAGRNLRPITEVLRAYLPKHGRVLEVGSGPGEHVLAWAREFPGLLWVPTDVSSRALESITHYRDDAGLANLELPQSLDLSEAGWEEALAERVDAIVAVNVLHVAPWAVSASLLSGAGRCLESGGQLFVYGPFKCNGAHISPSNAAFDESLRGQDPEWGIRDAGKLASLAKELGLLLVEGHEMPANNRILRFVAQR